ncbi:MAG TPA: tripartite tricarboxylate transporter substrate binding protein [Burkholderiaceae bacterium]|nr:tripartite tricarboxylate transporter substrate binding protein [Burkholderiaceae bacterium]
MKASKLIGSTAIAMLLSTTTWAQNYPERPVDLVVPYAAGGATDVIARLVATELPAQLGQPVVVVNKPGAGTTLAAAEIARSAPDGYKLYMTTAAHTISASLYSNLRYDPIKDFAPIHLVARIPIVLITKPDFEAKTLAEYVKIATTKKDGVTVGSPGNGSPQHLAQALFQKQTGSNFIHIPFRGDAPMLTDLLAGQIDSAFVTLSAALPHIEAGKVQALAVANPTRIPAIQNVPTMAEAGVPNFNAATWFGMFGPAGIDAGIQQRLHEAINKVASASEFTTRIEKMGGEVVNMGPAEFQEYVKAESAQWAQAVEASGARVE